MRKNSPCIRNTFYCKAALKRIEMANAQRDIVYVSHFYVDFVKKKKKFTYYFPFDDTLPAVANETIAASSTKKIFIVVDCMWVRIEYLAQC